MKLRIKGDSLRLRISPDEISQLLMFGRIEDTIHFGPQHDARLTYVLLITSRDPAHGAEMTVRYQPQEVAVELAALQARAWAAGTGVGLYATINTGVGQLELAVEKDFACLDKPAAENLDTFPHPNQGAAC